MSALKCSQNINIGICCLQSLLLITISQYINGRHKQTDEIRSYFMVDLNVFVSGI